MKQLERRVLAPLSRVIFKRKVNPIGFTKVDFGEPRFEPQELTLVNPIGFTFLKLVQIPNPEPI